MEMGFFLLFKIFLLFYEHEDCEWKFIETVSTDILFFQLVKGAFIFTSLIISLETRRGAWKLVH